MKTPTQTHKGITYWSTYEMALQYATAKGLPTDRIIEYGRGWAIQREVSGPYWNAVSESWL